MRNMKQICIFCGSSAGTSPLYEKAVRDCGLQLVSHGMGLVYGGGNVGLMGVLADAVLEGGGQVIGVIPNQLVARELAHRGLTQLITVESMHERKARMADLADGFLALPGGIGTMDEFFEAYTWLQLGFHKKPVAVLNVSGFFDPLLDLLRKMTLEGFLK